MKRFLLNISLLAAASLSCLTATIAKAETVTDSANLKDSDVELFNLFNSFVNAESLALDESALPELYADSLRWDPIASSVDVFFINEGAAYRNQLLYAINGGARTTLFDDIASTESIIKETGDKVAKYENQVTKLNSEISALEAEIAVGNLTAAEQSTKEDQLAEKQVQQLAKTEFLAVEKTLGNGGVGTLKLGDGKSVGGLSGDVAFDFFVKADGARRANGNIYGADASANADGLQHVIARELEYEGDSWVLVGFEDLYGVHEDEGGISDRDFNDVVFAVRGLTGDRVTSEEVPEPATAVALLAFGALGLVQTRRQNVS